MSLKAFYCRVQRVFARYRSVAQYATQAPELQPWSPVALVIRDLQNKCRHPIFGVVNRLGSVGPQERLQELPVWVVRRDLPDAHEWRWSAVLEAQNFSEAMEKLQAAGVLASEASLDSLFPKTPESDTPSEELGLQPPTWLVTHMLCNQAQTHDDVLDALKLVYFHLLAAPPDFRASLLIMTGIRLAQMSMVAPFRALIRAFLQFSQEINAQHMNMMIRTIALLPASREASTLSVGLVRLAATRQLLLAEKTYDALLSGTFATLGVAEAVEEVMREQRFTPTVHQLHRLLCLYAARRRNHKAARLLAKVRRTLKANAAPEIPHGPGRFGEPREGDTMTIHNRAYVASMKPPQHAYQYLMKVSRSRVHLDSRSRLGNGHTRFDPPGTNPLATLTVGDWVAGFRVAARSERVSSDALLRVFHDGQRVFGDRINVVAYVIAIQGLLRRWAIKQAMQLWEELQEPERHLWPTSMSLAVGVTVLTVDEKADEAFRLLQRLRDRQLDHERREFYFPTTPAVNIQAVNQFMVALHRTGRPDVVFALWDNMEVLYGFRPDAYSLNILLQSARWSQKYNMTIRGALAHFGLGMEREVEDDPTEDARAHATRKIASLLDPGHRHTRHNMWNGQSAPRSALRIAARVLLGNWPHLKTVESPVKPVSQSSIMLSLMGARSVGDATPSALQILSDELPESELFLQIMPTDVTFRAILDTLELLALAPEIPLLMAWMRSLRIKPSKDTLATALVYWSGVPNADRWGGREHSYRTLYAWMEQWVDKVNMPGPKEMSSTFYRLRVFNESKRADITASRIEKARSQRRRDS